MVIYREILASGGFIEHITLDTIPQGANYIEVDKTPTPEEIAEANKPKVPCSISRMNLKIQLLLRNIEIQDIIDTINSIPEVMFSIVDKQIAIIKFNEATSYDLTMPT